VKGNKTIKNNKTDTDRDILVAGGLFFLVSDCEGRKKTKTACTT